MERRKLNILLIALLVFSVVMQLQSCSVRRSMPLEGKLDKQTEEVKAGEVIYMAGCQRCHPHGEAGLGPAILWAPTFAMRIQVRNGIGVMPSFKKDKISSKEMDQLMAYIKVLKRNN